MFRNIAKLLFSKKGMKEYTIHFKRNGTKSLCVLGFQPAKYSEDELNDCLQQAAKKAIRLSKDETFEYLGFEENKK